MFGENRNRSMLHADRQVKPSFTEEVKPSFTEEVKPNFTEEVKPSFTEGQKRRKMCFVFLCFLCFCVFIYASMTAERHTS